MALALAHSVNELSGARGPSPPPCVHTRSVNPSDKHFFFFFSLRVAIETRGYSGQRHPGNKCP